MVLDMSLLMSGKNTMPHPITLISSGSKVGNGEGGFEVPPPINGNVTMGVALPCHQQTLRFPKQESVRFIFIKYHFIVSYLFITPEHDHLLIIIQIRCGSRLTCPIITDQCIGICTHRSHPSQWQRWCCLIYYRVISATSTSVIHLLSQRLVRRSNSSYCRTSLGYVSWRNPAYL